MSYYFDKLLLISSQLYKSIKNIKLLHLFVGDSVPSLMTSIKGWEKTLVVTITGALLPALINNIKVKTLKTVKTYQTFKCTCNFLPGLICFLFQMSQMLITLANKYTRPVDSIHTVNFLLFRARNIIKQNKTGGGGALPSLNLLLPTLNIVLRWPGNSSIYCLS